MPSLFLRTGAAAITLASSIALTPAHANNYGESLAWQFRTSADRVNLAVIADLIEKRRSGYYQAPVYNTAIERQYNCDITSSALGNSDNQTALANSPSVTGATSSANGNVSETDVSTGSGASAGTDQANSGAVSASVRGGTSATGSGTATQALNSTQTNSGDQSASVSASTACAFGMLN
ncbi:MAG: hypothetical protein B7Z20_01040 [Sphingobium sp. 32-64-5]|nr:MAG: hypothetical protein B7Z20_01040 [Sphingobium sp. 32-64-5]